MLSKIITSGIIGIDGYIIEAEADISEGLASFDIVGLPDVAVKESKERIKSAIKHLNCDLYKKRIVINLAPASLRKEGAHYDLPIALAVIGSRESFDLELLESSIFIGELSLNGELRHINGVLPMTISAYQKGIKNIFLPESNAKEADIVKGITVYPVRHLADVVFHLTGARRINPYVTTESVSEDFYPSLDFSDVKGQENIKRALLVAASGGHNILMLGNPGCGKTMIAKRIPSILPPLTFDESLEVSKIYSVAGSLKEDSPLIKERPFRQIHHTISTAGITGGGRIPKPGELSLSHRGVLFLDELPEFRRDALETLRQPLEEGEITVTRVAGTSTYPCNVMIVASMNPCPCGYYGSKIKECSCTAKQISTYIRKISGPLLDRIDIHIEVTPVDYQSLSDSRSKTDSAMMREEVMRTREIQTQRYKNQKFLTNKEIPASLIDDFCPLGDKEKRLMETAYHSLGLSARAHARILKVARTIADLDGKQDIASEHLAEAIQYRNLDKKYF